MLMLYLSELYIVVDDIILMIIILTYYDTVIHTIIICAICIQLQWFGYTDAYCVEENMLHNDIHYVQIQCQTETLYCIQDSLAS